jgi:hypothetical protein
MLHLLAEAPACRQAGRFAVCYAQAKFSIDRVLRHKKKSLIDGIRTHFLVV